MSFRKILFVPAADSLEQPGARRLVQLAGSEAEIEVFEPVYDPQVDITLAMDPRDYVPMRDEIVSKRLAKAEALAAGLRARKLSVSAAAAWDYPLYESVIRRVLKVGADLVITEPLGGRAGALSNSDWRLVAACPAAVLIVHSDGAKAYEHVVAAVDPFHAHAKPADLDETILAQALAIKALCHADLTVVHCFVPLTRVLGGADFEHLPVDDAESELERFRYEKLAQLAEAAGVPRGNARLLRGRAAEALLELATQGAADLVVMGALSRGRLQDLVIGSTAERIIANASVDVMIVKPGGFVTTVPTTPRDEPSYAPVYYPV